MKQPRIGEVWEQGSGEFVGRRGKIADTPLVWDNEKAIYIRCVVLDPYPGTCPCPAKQVRTRIRMDRFLKQFFYVKYPKGFPIDKVENL